jgi:curved DNA-binding protein CbpA
MTASRQDGEITFYEELGVPANASPEVIRDAFRLYVRLFHPDHQTDPQLKEVAEIQLRKFNRIYAVLSDQESRRYYDENLDEHYSPPIILANPSRNLNHPGARMAWVVAIIASAGLLLWLASDNTPAAVSRTPEAYVTSAPAANQLAQAAHVAQLQSQLQAVILQRDTAVLELEKLRRVGQVRPGQPQKPALTLTELPTATER